MRKILAAALAILPLMPGAVRAEGFMPALPAAFLPVECEDFSRGLARQPACGLLEVPENYGSLGGRSLLIPVMRLGPLNRDHMAVVLGGGGPGATVGMETLFEIAFWDDFRNAVLGPDRGLLLVEQRGVREDPPLQCEEVRLEADWILAADLSVEEEYGAFEGAAARCLARLRGSQVGLRHYTTQSSARDFEGLRLALGVDQLDLIAFSYASMIAFELMALHPDSVRVALLDSPLIPQAYSLHESVHLDRIFGDLSKKCLSLPTCANTYGDMRNNLRVAARRMDANPQRAQIPGAGGGSFIVLNSQRTIATVEHAFFRRDLVERLPEYLYELAFYGDSGMLDEYASNLAKFYRLDDLAEALHYSIVCREQMPYSPSEPPDVEIEWTKIRQLLQAKRFCSEVWDVGGPLGRADIPSNGQHPMLFLTGTLDWITPGAVTAEAVAGLAGAFHASVNATHGTLFNNSCSILVAQGFMVSAGARADHPCLERQAQNFP